jgi:hypothetical protein
MPALETDTRHPGNNDSIAKSQDEIEMEGDTAALTDNQAHDGRITAERRHEVDERHNAAVGFETGLQDQIAASTANRSIRPWRPAPPTCNQTAQ